MLDQQNFKILKLFYFSLSLSLYFSLQDSALKLLSRMFDSTTSYKAGEVYRILMGSLINHFRGPGKANIEAGLDPSTGTNTKLLQRVSVCVCVYMYFYMSIH